MNYDEQKREIDFMEYWRVIEKRKWVAILFASSIILITAIFTFTAVPRYETYATILIEEEVSTKIMNIQDEFGNPRAASDMRDFNTQMGMLRSKNLATRVAERLKISSRPEMIEGIMPKRSFFSTIKNIITLKWLLSGKGEEKTPRTQSLPHSAYQGLIRSNLKVDAVRNTKFVTISYSSSVPRTSAEIVNAYAEEFKNFASSLKYEKTEKFSSELGQQINDLRSQLEDARKQRQKYATDRDLILSSSENEESSTAYSDYQRISNAHTQAINRKNGIGAILALARDSDIDSLASINYPRIQPQQTEYLNAKNDYDEKSRNYRENHPDYIRAKDRLDRAKQNLKQAVSYIESDYRLASQEEITLRAQLNRQESEIIKMQSDIGVYRTLDVKVQSLDAQLISLEGTKNELDAAKGLETLKTSSISVVDKAYVPVRPVSPKKTKNLFFALLFGIFGGIALCFFLESLDNTVKGPEEVEKIAGLPSLGVIPLLEQEDSHGKGRHYSEYGSEEDKQGMGIDKTKPDMKDIELINHFHPRLPIADDYRTLRTSILLSYADSPPKVIAFTSSLPEEGKSATLVNLSVAFAQLERKVLVIDSDIRKPRLHRIFKIGNIGGLSGYLSGKLELTGAIQKTSIKNIWLLPSGPVPPNPSELLNSERMKEMLEEVRKVFDMVLLDTPPVLATIDAVIISTLVDSTVIVLKAGEITKKPFMSAVEELKRANVKIIGVVFNGLKASEGKYFYRGYYPYYRYGYYGSKELKSYMDGEH